MMICHLMRLKRENPKLASLIHKRQQARNYLNAQGLTPIPPSAPPRILPAWLLGKERNDPGTLARVFG